MVGTLEAGVTTVVGGNNKSVVGLHIIYKSIEPFVKFRECPCVAVGIVAVTVKENDDGTSKLSLRSKPPVNVSNVCAKFGGGGHTMAAGCKIAADVQEAARLVLAAINEEWPV